MGRTPKLGQHLLTNPSVARAVAELSGAERGVNVFEIGPGKGALTGELLALGARVTAVEKDPTMVAALRERFEKEIANGQLDLIHGDIRDGGLGNMRVPYVVAANIPYYITGEIIRTLLTAPSQPHTIALLVQKEVAERIARSKKESILSLSVKVYGTPRYAKTVKRGSFAPPPKVDSAILVIENISRERFKTVSEDSFFKVVKAGFAQKRKTLAGNLKRAFGETFDVPEKIRAEDVLLGEWLALAKKLEA